MTAPAQGARSAVAQHEPKALSIASEEDRLRLAALAGAIVPAGLTPQATLAFLKSAAKRRPRRARCLPCGHVWTLCFEPMPEERLALCIARATCPSCGETDRIGDVPTIKAISLRARKRRDETDLS